MSKEEHKVKNRIRSYSYNNLNLINADNIFKKSKLTIRTCNYIEENKINLEQIYGEQIEMQTHEVNNSDVININDNLKTLENNIQVNSFENNTDSNLISCKVCYEKEENENNKLISPCTCQGTVKFIHQNCLKTWIIKQDLDRPEMAQCEICKSPYVMLFKLKNVFSRTKCCKFVETIFTFIIIFLIILTLFSTLFYLLITR